MMARSGSHSFPDVGNITNVVSTKRKTRKQTSYQSHRTRICLIRSNPNSPKKIQLNIQFNFLETQFEDSRLEIASPSSQAAFDNEKCRKHFLRRFESLRGNMPPHIHWSVEIGKEIVEELPKK